MRAFWAKLLKRGSLFKKTKKHRNFWLINEKLIWSYFCFSCCFLSVCFHFVFVLLCFVGLRVRWGGPKGHLTWPQTLLACLVSFLFSFGGFKGLVRWPKGPPHLALNPPFFWRGGLFCFCFVFFLLFLFLENKNVFPLEKASLFIFSVSPFLFLPSFSPSPFSISLSLSLSCCFFISSLFSFFIGFFCCLVFVSSFLCLCSWKEQHQNNQLDSFLSILSLFGYLSCLSFKDLFLIFAFSFS